VASGQTQRYNLSLAAESLGADTRADGELLMMEADGTAPEMVTYLFDAAVALAKVNPEAKAVLDKRATWYAAWANLQAYAIPAARPAPAPPAEGAPR
jgi:hypothetical protein